MPRSIRIRRGNQYEAHAAGILWVAEFDPPELEDEGRGNNPVHALEALLANVLDDRLQELLPMATAPAPPEVEAPAKPRRRG